MHIQVVEVYGQLIDQTRAYDCNFYCWCEYVLSLTRAFTVALNCCSQRRLHPSLWRIRHSCTDADRHLERSANTPENETLSRWCCHTGSNYDNIYHIFSEMSPIWYKKKPFLNVTCVMLFHCYLPMSHHEGCQGWKGEANSIVAE